jgi:transcriptional regulator with XRE-family HTH domain
MTLFSEAFSYIVKEFRHAAGMSKAALAAKSGLHQTYIGLLENGDRSPSVDTAKAISDAFGVPLSKMVLAAEKRAKEFKREIEKERKLKK